MCAQRAMLQQYQPTYKISTLQFRFWWTHISSIHFILLKGLPKG
jgi:hypothetical protein